MVVVDRLFVDLMADGRVSVRARLADGLQDHTAIEPRELLWPMDDDALEELRWYLEDYLRAPFGAYESRGQEVANGLTAWGKAIFDAVFCSGAARDVYQSLRERGNEMQVVFQSSSADLLRLPWELMRDPARGLPLVLDTAGIDRCLPTTEPGEVLFAADGRRLRVLMVISRPAGTADVGFQMIARPLLARLRAVRAAVDLVVLRPPTLDALAGALADAAAAGDPFQVVHFDGHGALTSGPAHDGGTSTAGEASEGVLVFQGPDGKADRVAAARVARVLAKAQVPVVVLNACQSGAVGKELEAAIATRLLREGVASVVAMAYSVYAVAAAVFMAGFYERVFAGDTISSAVSAGRRRMSDHDLRPSVLTDLPLADWAVPVHYMRREIRFNGLAGTPAVSPPAEAADADQALAPVGGFTGRDGLFYELETALRLQRVVVLYGTAGSGKTELAKAFGRWWRDTAGVERPEWVFWHSFEPGLSSGDLNDMISAIGLAAFGTDFARISEAERVSTALDFLRAHRTLLILDSFECARSLPDPSAAAPPLSEAACGQLAWFLREMAAGGQGAVLVTSRTNEAWLDDSLNATGASASRTASLCRIPVPGLTPAEAAAYASGLLSSNPAAAARRTEQAFGELLEWLDGHPLTMRLVLPHLAHAGSQALLAGLRGAGPVPGWNRRQGRQGRRDASLSASLGYSFSHLDHENRQLLVAVCLFQATVDANVLAVFSAVPEVPGHFAGISGPSWAAALDEAAGAGLLTKLGAGMYRIHPALPAFLAGIWREQATEDHEAQRTAATQALLTAYTVFSLWQSQLVTSDDAGLSLVTIGLQRRTIGSLVNYALDTEQWVEARALARLLCRYWKTEGLYAETAAFTDRVIAVVTAADGQPPALDTPAGQLWLYCVGQLAERQTALGQLDEADQACRGILAMLTAQPDSDQRQERLGVTSRLLGTIAERRGRLDEAADWYARAQGIFEQLGDQAGAASVYHHLGVLAEGRGRLDEAADWHARSLGLTKDQSGLAASYHHLGTLALERGQYDEGADWHFRSLDILRELGDQAGIAAAYHHLGNVAFRRGELEEAADWHFRSLVITEQLGDRPKVAAAYAELGTVALARGRLDEAADWYGRALSLLEQLGARPEIAVVWYQLGLVAYDGGRLEEAAEWYNQSLEAMEALGDQPKIALTCRQLQRIAERRWNADEALEWAIKCAALSGDSSYVRTGTGPELALHAFKLGMDAFEARWRRATGRPVPDTIRDLVRSRHPEVSSRPRLDVFTFDAALEFLSEQTGLTDPAGAATLAGALGFECLALVKAATVIVRRHLTYADYLDRLAAMTTDGNLVKEQGQAYPSGLAKAVAFAMRAILDDGLGGLPFGVMFMMAVLSPAGVRRNLLNDARVAALVSGVTNDAPAGVADNALGALGALGELSLVTFSPDGQTVIVHPLVMLVIRDVLARSGQLARVCRTAGSILKDHAQELEQSKDRASMREFAAQVTALNNQVEGGACTPDNQLTALVVTLRWQALVFLNDLGDSAQDAIAIGEPLTAYFEQLAGPDHSFTLNSRTMLGNAYCHAGRIADAIQAHQDVLAARERVLGPDHPDTVISRNNLTAARRLSGHADK